MTGWVSHIREGGREEEGLVDGREEGEKGLNVFLVAKREEEISFVHHEYLETVFQYLLLYGGGEGGEKCSTHFQRDWLGWAAIDLPLRRQFDPPFCWEFPRQCRASRSVQFCTIAHTCKHTRQRKTLIKNFGSRYIHSPLVLQQGGRGNRVQL